MTKTEQTFPLKLHTAQRSMAHVVEKTRCLTRAVHQVIQTESVELLPAPELEQLLARAASVRQELADLEAALQEMALRKAT